MSAVVAEKASLADDDSHIRNNGDLECNVSIETVTTSTNARGAQANDKDTDNRAVDSQPTSSSRQSHSPPKGLMTGQEHTERSDSGLEVVQNDSSSLNGRRPSTTSRFKEKRPEPLKLNPNQEKPLDLSVKSAGNVPSGNIFNLMPLSNLMGPLETPRIQWQDNDSLLNPAKNRLFSSSTSTSQRARISSLIGESPPITPNTPLMDLMFSPSGTSAMRASYEMPHSASLALESPFRTLFMSPFELNKLQILDKSFQPSKSMINPHYRRSETTKTPRRSCSTDDLDYTCDQPNSRVKTHITNMLNITRDDASRKSPGSNSKKNSVSSLATKNISNQMSAANSPTKFSYTNQHIAKNKDDAQRSPSSSNSSSTNGKSLTPTGVANATANLLNIHINSPSRQSSANLVFDDNRLPNNQNHNRNSNLPLSYDQESSSLDPLISAASYCQQQQQRSPFANIPSTSDGTDQNNNSLIPFHQHSQILNSHSSTATLNTPTLISPSQLKAGHMCFLPSPTLSPMSSVFELPSPFLMFPPASTQTQQQQQQQHQRSFASFSSSEVVKIQKTDSNSDDIPDTNEATTSTDLNLSKVGRDNPSVPASANSKVPARRSCSENDLPPKASVGDLSHLITMAAQKSGPHQSIIDKEDTDDEINMEIDADNSNLVDSDVFSQNNFQESSTSTRPATVIPQICVSNHQLNKSSKELIRPPCNAGDPELGSTEGTSFKQCGHVETMPERSLSPKTHWSRLTEYNHERHESSSAPPEVYQTCVKSKLKTIAADSCFNLTDKNIPRDRASKMQAETYVMHNTPASLSHSDMNNSAFQRDRSSSRPYPNMREIVTASSHQINKNHSGPSLIGTRSNSAEPAVYRETNSGTVLNQTLSSNQNENLYESQLHLRQNISSSAQHLTHASNSEVRGLSSSNGLHNQHQQQGQSLSSNHQSLYQQQRMNWDQQGYHPQQDQRQELNYQHQQSSISASNLHRQQNNNDRHGCQAQFTSHPLVANSNDAVSMQNDRHHQHGQHKQFFQQNQQTMVTPLNRFDNLTSYNCYQQQQQIMQRARQNTAPSMMNASNSVSFGPTEHQSAATSHPYSNNFEPHESALRYSSMNILLTGEQKHQLSTSLAHSVDPLCRQTGPVHCTYALESESRSESRSSCSLDFTSPFCHGSGGGGLNHSTSSNLVAKKYHCDHCSKSFTRSDMLTRHRRLHSGDRPFQCSECKQEFSRSDHLSTHMRTHTGEKPYKCKLCSYSACRKDMITRHLKVHNRNPNSAEPT